MNNCPKCGACRMTGPRYEKSRGMDAWSTIESLVYHCSNCGYERREPTLDQREANAMKSQIDWAARLRGATA